MIRIFKFVKLSEHNNCVLGVLYIHIFCGHN